MRVSPPEQKLLRRVAAVNDVGSTYLVNATKRTTDGQSRIIGALIGRGLLVDSAGSAEAGAFFSTGSRAYALQVTELGHECLAALGPKS